jgi:type II secretory pathway component PulJ
MYKQENTLANLIALLIMAFTLAMIAITVIDIVETHWRVEEFCEARAELIDAYGDMYARLPEGATLCE